MTPVVVDPEEAAQIMRQAGVEPMEPYPGARVGWQVRCQSCGSISRPLYSSVKKGLGGCNTCAKKKSAAKLRSRGFEQTRHQLELAGWKLLVQEADYKNARSRVEVACLKCGRRKTGEAFGLKTSICECSKSARRPLEDDFPKLFQEIDPEKNGRLDFRRVGTGMRNNIWWLCSKGHSYEASPANRVRGTGCPFCAGNRVEPGVNDLGSQLPSLAREWHPTKNQMSPDEVHKYSNKKAWWQCPRDPRHEYSSTISDRAAGTACPICAGKKVVSGINDFASQVPELLREWHPTKNNTPPDRIYKSTLKKVWWQCSSNPDHEWRTSVAKRVNGSGCPYCSGQRVIPGQGDLASTHPELLAEWHPTKNSELDPSRMTPNSGQHVWWRCQTNHNHEWRRSPAGRVFFKSGCPFCSGKALLRGFNDLATLNPELAEEFDLEKNYPKTPEDIRIGSNAKVWWRCRVNNSHVWQTTPHSRIKSGCPECGQFGYRSTRPGIFYLLKNESLRAGKVGITNQNNRHSRLDQLRKLGFEVVQLWRHQDGAVLRELETQTLRFIRQSLGLPPFLGKLEMGSTAGWRETFGSDDLDFNELQMWINEKFIKMDKQLSVG